ncbi:MULTISPECIES: biotin transporter BioY [Arthrobacter]|uniref:biotin transporter BioY n=1 Tax=Arthrobacter TaxID=1663 RepID=UPI0009EB5716|nr:MULTISPECIES: biotin transporter BioY [Arthrobacter]
MNPTSPSARPAHQPSGPQTETDTAQDTTPGPAKSAGSAPGTGKGRRRQRWSAGDLSLIAVFAALLAASIAVPGVNVGPLGVAITLQTLVVTLCGLVLGLGRGTAAVGLYILLGLVGLPIFSGFRAGPAVLASPSAGYIVGFIFGVAVVGLLARWALLRRVKAVALFGAALAGMVVIHVFGIAGLVFKGMGLGTAITADAIFLPGDILKCLIAVAIALSLHRAFPDLLLRRRR